MMDEKRIHLLKQYIDKDPEDPFNRYALAMEYYDEHPLVAIDLLKNLHHSCPDYLPNYYKLAHLYWEMGHWEEAEDIFREGIVLAEKMSQLKTLQELKSAYQNFEFEKG